VSWQGAFWASRNEGTDGCIQFVISKWKLSPRSAPTLRNQLELNYLQLHSKASNLINHPTKSRPRPFLFPYSKRAFVFWTRFARLEASFALALLSPLPGSFHRNHCCRQTHPRLRRCQSAIRCTRQAHHLHYRVTVHTALLLSCAFRLQFPRGGQRLATTNPTSESYST